MRKDLERLGNIYRPNEDDNRSDIEILRRHNARDVAADCNRFHGKVAFAQDALKAVWPSVTFGPSFQSLSKRVDWQRDDLFYRRRDDIVSFCKRDLSRHVSVGLDYGRWEVATIARMEPLTTVSNAPKRW